MAKIRTAGKKSCITYRKHLISSNDECYAGVIYNFLQFRTYYSIRFNVEFLFRTLLLFCP